MWPTSLEKPLHKPPMHTKAPESAFALIIGGFLEKDSCFLSVRGTKTSCISIEIMKLSPEKLACSIASISLVVLRTFCTIRFALSCLCKIVSLRNKKCPVFNHQCKSNLQFATSPKTYLWHCKGVIEAFVTLSLGHLWNPWLIINMWLKTCRKAFGDGENHTLAGQPATLGNSWMKDGNALIPWVT